MDYDIYCGIDVGKTSLHVVALEKATDVTIFDSLIDYEVSAIRKVLETLSLQGKTLVTLDQCGGFGNMVVEITRDTGLDIAHIPPRRFRDVADCFGEDKTDALDAHIIAETAMCMPRFIDPVCERETLLAEAKALLSYREAIGKERTAAINRMHALLQQSCPPLAAVFSGGGWKLGDPLSLQIMAKYGGASGLRRSGQVRAERWASSIKHYPQAGPRLIKDMFDAISGQNVYASEGEAIERIIRTTAERVLCATSEKAELDEIIEAKLALTGKLKPLMSIAGIGPHLAAVILCEVGEIERFPSEAHLASYGGVAPVKKESGARKGTRKRKGGNRLLKHALVFSAKLAVQHHNAESLTYFEKKCKEGKSKNAAYLALARCRIPMIYEILRSDS